MNWPYIEEGQTTQWPKVDGQKIKTLIDKKHCTES
jgi:hypothetical protein